MHLVVVNGEYESGLDRIVEFVKYDAGDANCLRFWHDKWSGENTKRAIHGVVYNFHG